MLWTRTTTIPFGILWRFGGIWRVFVLVLLSACAAMIKSNSILSAFLFACAIIILWYFRGPLRSIAQASPIVVSPVDGVIEKIDKGENIPFCSKAGTVVVISSSFFNAGVIRAPLTGKVDMKVQATQDSGDKGDGHTGILCTDSRGSSLFLGAKSNESRNRIVLAPIPGDSIEHGAIIGFNSPGKNVEMLFQNENGYKPVIAKGQKVKSGQTIIAIRRDTRAKNVVI